MEPFELLRDRINREQAASEAAHCDSLLNSCEMVIRHLTALLCSILPESETGNSVRYRTEYELIRSSGIGDWSRQAQNLLAGPNYSLIAGRLEGGPFEGALAQFSRSAKSLDDTWIVALIEGMRQALSVIGEKPSDARSIKLIEFLREFPRLRNKMDAHGAPTSGDKAEIALFLEKPIGDLLTKLTLLKIPIVSIELARIDPDKAPKVLDVVGNEASGLRSRFEDGYLPRSHSGGLFTVASGSPTRINLACSEPDLRDFFYANGSFSEGSTSAEFLSYITNKRKRVNAADWSAAPASLVESLTAGESELRIEGKSFTNFPSRDSPKYVKRNQLEAELLAQLAAPYRRVISLKGLGGVGKTSLALNVVKEVCHSGLFDVVIWASARDLDLLENSARPVKPSIQSSLELAELSRSLYSQMTADYPGDPLEWFGHALQSDDQGRVLWVLDNFETLQDPADVYSLIDRSLGPSNRVLITTRHRDFYGDYEIEVRGLERSEFQQLVDEFSTSIGVRITSEKAEQIFRETDGHPYITKMMISDFKVNPLTAIKTVANRADLQENLLERTYSRLSEGSSNLFLLLSTFNSVILGIALRVAVADFPIFGDDVESLLDELASNSMVELTSLDNDFQVELPAVTRAFGQRKLVTSDFRTSILAMSEVLKLFGPIDKATAASARSKRLRPSGPVTRFWQTTRKAIEEGGNAEHYLRLAADVARSEPELWRSIAEYHQGTGETIEAIAAWKMYIESGQNHQHAWWQLALLFETLNRDDEALSAWVSRAQCEDASIEDVSFAANKVNGWLSRRRVVLLPAQVEVLIRPLISVLEHRISECKADDYARLAHLHKRLDNGARAWELADLGLKLEPENEHCLRILNRY